MSHLQCHQHCGYPGRPRFNLQCREATTQHERLCVARFIEYCKLARRPANTAYTEREALHRKPGTMQQGPMSTITSQQTQQTLCSKHHTEGQDTAQQGPNKRGLLAWSERSIMADLSRRATVLCSMSCRTAERPRLWNPPRPPPQLRQRARSLPVPRGRRAIAGGTQSSLPMLACTGNLQFSL